MQNLRTVRDWIRWGSSEFNAKGLFFGHGTDNAWDEAAVLVLWAIHQPWTHLPDVIDACLTDAECRKVEQVLLTRTDERVPAAYITGEAWFGGLKFIVNREVLVPRSPIAELIANGFEPWITQPPRQILDLCAGSGCIGILCAKFFDAEVHLSDISNSALAVARKNIALHQLQHQVTAVASDLFAGLAGRKYDLIVSNPPYVDKQDIRNMPAEFCAEPEIALAGGDDGLDLVRLMLREATDYLTEQGLLVVEVGNSWLALESAFPEVPFLWPEFENGGHGVFILSAQQLSAYAHHFAS